MFIQLCLVSEDQSGADDITLYSGWFVCLFIFIK